MKLLVKIRTMDILSGEPKSCFRCPIARRLNLMGFLPQVYFNRVVLRSLSSDRYNLETQLPKEAKQFVQDFDDGKKVSPIEFELEFEDCDLSKYKRMGSNG